MPPPQGPGASPPIRSVRPPDPFVVVDHAVAVAVDRGPGTRAEEGVLGDVAGIVRVERAVIAGPVIPVVIAVAVEAAPIPAILELRAADPALMVDVPPAISARPTDVPFRAAGM